MRNRVIINSGFTLFELLIAITIIAILAVLAYPSYRESVMKARRADAQTDLLTFENTAERLFNQDNSYANVDTLKPNNSDFYTYTVAKTATTYSITATPTAIQADDQCGTMTLTSTGLKEHYPPLYPGSSSSFECWGEPRS